jgi:hypothetical protein
MPQADAMGVPLPRERPHAVAFRCGAKGETRPWNPKRPASWPQTHAATRGEKKCDLMTRKNGMMTGRMAILVVAGLASVLAAESASATIALGDTTTPAECTSQAGPDDTSIWCCYREPDGTEHCDEYQRYCYETEEGQEACGGWTRTWQCVRHPGGSWFCERPDGLQCRETPLGWDCSYPEAVKFALLL